MFSRRKILQFSAVGLGAASISPIAFAAQAATPKKLLFVLQRGAADGLAILSPFADPALRGLRGEEGERAGEGHRLDSTFALHPALGTFADLHAKGDALFVHAVASPYRDRSHFDGQNVLESGGAKAYQVKDGWLNRLLGQLDGASGLALAPTVPLALRGAVPVASYAPSRLPDAESDLMARIGDLYARDDMLGPIWNAAQEAREMAGSGGQARGGAALGALAGKMMKGPDGASILMVESDGWDTHFRQAPRLAGQLGQLDAMVAAYRGAMGDEWKNVMIIIATEFGRTAAINGTGGTDHGTGALAMLAGGAVKGGRVIADWPGLGRLHEGRDLLPTTGLDALIASALAQHFALDPARLSALLFPQTRPSPLGETLVV